MRPLPAALATVTALLGASATARPEPPPIRYVEESRFRNHGEAEHVSRRTFVVQPLEVAPGRLRARVRLLEAEGPSLKAPPPWRDIPLVVSFDEETQEAELLNWAQVQPRIAAAVENENVDGQDEALRSNPGMLAMIGVRMIATAWAVSVPPPVKEGFIPLSRRGEEDWLQDRTWIVRKVDPGACTAEVERTTVTRWLGSPERNSTVRTTALISTSDGWPIEVTETHESAAVSSSGGEPLRTTLRRLDEPHCDPDP